MATRREHDSKVESVLRKVRDLPAAERSIRLRELCDHDEALLDEVGSLLLYHAHAEPPDQGGNVNVHVETRVQDAGRSNGDEPPIGDYRIHNKLGHGGMGDVYLGERTDGDVSEYVAIKVLKRGLDTEQFLRRFKQERQILSAIHHSGVAGFLDAGESDDGRPYYVMQYVDGLPLDEYCDAHRLDIEERLRLFQKVCDAVDCVNRHLIIHRDLKPRNILVTEDSQPKLLDFGIARFLNPDLASGGAPPTGPESSVMTPEYASPEQVRGNPLTTASDVYSLGVLLYEILSGHPPYRLRRDSRDDRVEKVCERDPDAPSTAVGFTELPEPALGLRESITPETVGRSRRSDPGRLRRRLQGDLDRIVMQALRKEPQRRYQSARELSDDIGRHLDNRPVVASADTLVYRLSKFVRRNRVAVAAAVFVMLSLVIGATSTSYGLVEATQARDRAHDHLETLVGVALKYIDDLENAVETLDGSMSLRLEFAETAVNLLEKSTRTLEGREDRDARLTLARAYRRRGEVEGSRRNPNRGDADTALRWYQKSQEQAEAWLDRAPDDPEAKRELAFTLMAQGDVRHGRPQYEEAQRLDEQAHALLAELHEVDPADWQARTDLAASLVVLGRDARGIWRDTGRTNLEMHKLAESHFRSALELRRGLVAERPDDKDAVRALSVVLLRVGVVEDDVGDFKEARRHYEESVDIRRKLVGREPGNARHRHDLNTVLYLTAALLERAGVLDEAVEFLKPTIPVWQETLLRNPSDVRPKQGLAMAQVLLGQLRLGQQRWDEAEIALHAGLAHASQLHERFRKQSNYRRLVAESRHGLAKVEFERGDAIEAQRYILTAIELVGREPELLADLARVQLAMGEVEEARNTAMEALDGLENREGAEVRRVRSALHGVLKEVGEDPP